MENLLDAEDCISKALEGLVNEGFIFTEQNIKKLTKDIFPKDMESPVAIVILYAGYKTLSHKSRGKGVLIKPLWRVLAVTPSDLYKSHAGVKIVEIIKRLSGLSIDDRSKPMHVVDDAREFNEADFVSNLYAIPSVFGYDAVL